MSERGVHRLVPELVPSPLWGRSASRLLSRSDWRRLRQAVLQEAEGHCQVCGDEQEKGMVAHEVWAYNDDDAVATLVDVRLHCRPCDSVVHIGFTGRVLGPEALERAKAHMMRINSITRSEVEDLVVIARSQWHERSSREWRS